MTMNGLRQQIDSALWFSKLGSFTPHGDFVRISNLRAWAGTSPDQPLDASEEMIADDMEWLPSSQTEEDPIHGNQLALQARKVGAENELKRARMDIYKATLASLGQRLTPSPLLMAGAHDFSEAAKGAALFAARMAATEILTDKQGFWCSLIPLYQQGYWPCGRLSSGKVVVL